MTWRGFIAGFIFGMFIGLSIPHLATQVKKDTAPEPLECIDGKLYEVTIKGKIKILDRSAYMDCEVIK